MKKCTFSGIWLSLLHNNNVLNAAKESDQTLYTPAYLASITSRGVIDYCKQNLSLISPIDLPEIKRIGLSIIRIEYALMYNICSQSENCNREEFFDPMKRIRGGFPDVTQDNNYIFLIHKKTRTERYPKRAWGNFSNTQNYGTKNPDFSAGTKPNTIILLHQTKSINLKIVSEDFDFSKNINNWKRQTPNNNIHYLSNANTSGFTDSGFGLYTTKNQHNN
jgi:hypothetical protein